MMWKMSFTYQAAHDVVLARFDGVELTTSIDAARWAAEVDEKLGAFGRKVTLIIDLTGLVVRPTAAAEFGRLRAEVLAKHSTTSYRFGGDRATVTSVYTSAVIHHADANHFASYEAALAAVKREREAEAEVAASSRRRPVSSGAASTSPVDSTSAPSSATAGGAGRRSKIE
jgi:hypothetical protein